MKNESQTESQIESQTGGEPAAGRQSWGFRFVLLHLVTVFGIALSNAFLGLALLTTLFRRKAVHGSRLVLDSPGGRAMLWPLVIYAIAFLVSALASANPGISLGKVTDLLSLSTLPLVVLWVDGERQVRQIVAWLLALMGLLCGYGIVQFLFTDYGNLDHRIPGPFSHYMTFSGVLLVGLCLLVPRVLRRAGLSHVSARSGRVERLMDNPSVEWTLLGLLLVTLCLTLTRSAWIGAVVVVALALWLQSRRFVVAFVIVLVLSLAASAVALPRFWQRAVSIVDLENPSNYDRVCMARAGVRMIRERPLFGLGPGMVAERYPIYRELSSPRVEVAHLHNTIIHMWSERGVFSVLAYLALMVGAAGIAWRRFAREGGLGGARADLYLAVLLTVVGLNVAGLFEANWRDTEIRRLALFVLAIPLCLKWPGHPEL
jgi:O-antigen ligase